MVVKFADVACPDGLEMHNSNKGLIGDHLATVCGPRKRNNAANDDTAIYTDSDGAYVTFRTLPGKKRGRGFVLTWTVVDPDNRMYSLLTYRVQITS